MKKGVIRIIKNASRRIQKARPPASDITAANKWSKAVRSWVQEFQDRATTPSFKTFDHLFESNSEAVSERPNSIF